MADDDERLLVLLEARITDFEKNLKKASATATREFAGMRKTSASASQQMESDVLKSTTSINRALASVGGKVGSLGKNLTTSAIAPVAALLTLSAAVNGTKSALDKFSKINDQSIAAGIDPEFFQGIAYQAKLSGVGIDNVAEALATFAKNAGLASEGKGRMVATLQALNPELLKNIQAANSQEERIRLVADAIKNAKDQAQAAAIASAAFGDSGVKLVQSFADGGAAIDQTIAKAKEMGIIVDRDVIAHADELGDKWDTVATILDTKVKSALIGLAPSMVKLVDLAAQYAGYMSDQLDGKKPMNIPSWGDQTQQHLGDVLRGLAYPETSVAGLPRRYSQSQYDFGNIADFYTQQTTDAFAALNGGPHSPVLTPVRSAGADTLSPGRHEAGQTRAGDTPGENVQTVADGLDRVTKAAKDSSAAIGGVDDSVDLLAERWQDAEDMAQSFGSTLLSDLQSGKGAVDSLVDAFGNLTDQLEQMVVNQGIQSLFSGLEGMFGVGSIKGGAAIPSRGFVPGITGPKLFAAGGVTDRPAIFGDDGAEAAVPLPDGRRIPVDLRGSAAGAPVLNLTIVNQSGQPVSAEAGPGRNNGNGSFDQTIMLRMVDDAIAKNGSTPGSSTSRMLKTNFGMRQQLVRR